MNHLIGALGNGTVRAVLTPHADKRQLIGLRGRDTFKFLQSMTTKKVLDQLAAEESGEFCDFVSFLNPKGRVLSEALLVFRAPSRSWFLDVPTTSLGPLLQHFNQYKMRNQFMVDVEEVNKAYKVWSLVATSENNLKELSLWLLNQTSQMDVMFYQDPRLPLAFRLIAPSHSHPLSQMPPLGDIYVDDMPENQSLYHYLRNLHGVSEGSHQIIPQSSIPFECNIDLMGGIDYDKGCCLGQELVARTHYRGAVRKRLFPLVSLGNASTVPANAQMSSTDLVSSLMQHRLSIGEMQLLPPDMLQPIANLTSPTQPQSNGKTAHVNVELSNLYSATHAFPTEGGPILPIHTDTELEAVLSGKGLSQRPLGAASASRVSKIAGGSSFNVGMGMMRAEDWHSSPSLLFYAPSASDPTQGTLFKGVMPSWYPKYMHWREEAESKALAQSQEEL